MKQKATSHLHSKASATCNFVIDLLYRRIEAGAEVSMEADPGTFDAARLREYMDLGVTRFSIGVQAFQQVALPILC